MNTIGHAPGYLSSWNRGVGFTRELAWFPADLKGYRSNVIRSHFVLTTERDELAAGERAILGFTTWDGAPMELGASTLRFELSDPALAEVEQTDAGWSLVANTAGIAGWVTVRAVLVDGAAERFSSVRQVRID